jgi:hypothetical protein
VRRYQPFDPGAPLSERYLLPSAVNHFASRHTTNPPIAPPTGIPRMAVHVALARLAAQTNKQECHIGEHVFLRP